MQNDQIHIDLETMDTAHTAQVLSIGAVCGHETFYCEIDRSHYDPLAFTTSPETVAWWEKQGGFKPSVEAVSPSKAVHDLSMWIAGVTAQMHEFEVWANSPTFDCDILLHHFKYFSIAPPWRFWQERDVRTAKAMARRLKLNIREFKNPHHALQDAKNQQAMVDSVYQTLCVKVQMAKECGDSLPPGMAVTRGDC